MKRYFCILGLFIFAIFGLTACGGAKDTAIEWKDPVIEAGIRSMLQKPDGDILPSELNSITDIQIIGNKIVINQSVQSQRENYDVQGQLTTLEDLQHMHKLQNIRLNHTGISSLESAKELAPLKELIRFMIHEEKQLQDITPLGALTNIKQVNIMQTGVQDISVFKKLPKLERVSISLSSVEDLSPLAGTNVKELYIQTTTPIKNWDAIGSMKKLTRLSVSFTFKNEDMPLLQGLTSLEYLNLSSTHVADISVLANLPGLKELSLVGTKVTDLTPLSQAKNLVWLDVRECDINNFSPVAHVAEVLQGEYKAE